MEAIEHLTQKVQGNFNRRKEWDQALACAIDTMSWHLGRIKAINEDEFLLKEWKGWAEEKTTQLAKTINIFESLRDLDDHQ